MIGNTLSKNERLCSRTAIEELFGSSSHRSMTVFPLRAVYVCRKRFADEEVLQLLVSVPKKCFKRAVKRNYVKRQVREAYRLNKHILVNHLTQKADKTVSLCFIWTSDRLLPTAEVMKRMANLLTRLVEKLSANDNKNTPQ